MNPKQILINQLQNQLKAKNPQMFSQLQSLMKDGNPQEILNNITSNYTPEQRQQFAQFVNGFGISNDELNQILTR